MTDRSTYFATGEDWPTEAMLASWQWLIGTTPYAIHRVTVVGNLFLRDPAGAILFLDTTDGQLERVADSADKFDALFDSTDNRRRFLWTAFVRELQKDSPQLNRGQCYGWKVSPCLGGEIALENMEPTDVATHVSLQGQLHEQTRSPAPGTRIDDVRIIARKLGWWQRLFDRSGK